MAKSKISKVKRNPIITKRGNYAYGSYFDDRNKMTQLSQTAANTVGQAIPIAGVFKGIGEGAANLIAPKDQYGVSDKGGFAQGVAGFLNPMESISSVWGDMKKGEFDKKTAMQLLLPGVGSVMQNKENKAERDKMLLQEKMKGINAGRIGQYNSANPQMLPTYALGGDVNEINQRNDMGWKYYAWGGTPSWDPNERPMHNSMYAAGGDINKLSDLKGYGYNLMPNGGYVESPAWYRSNALTMESGGHLPEGNSTLKEAKEFLKLYPEEMEAGTEVEYEHTGNKKLAQRIAADHVKDSLKMNQGNPPDYYKRLQEAGISDELNKMPQMQMAKGGFLSKEKAGQILKDGKIRNKPLTDRQRRYFGYIAGGGVPMKMGGGPMDSLQTYADGGKINSVQRPAMLPNVNIYGARDKNTDRQLNSISGKTNPVAFSKEQYDNTWNSWLDNGAPKITPLINDGKTNNMAAGVGNAGKGRAYYMSGDNEMFIRSGVTKDYMAELAHANQVKHGVFKSDLDRYRARYGKDPSTAAYDKFYDDPTSNEYAAHKVIEPELRKRYNMNYALGGIVNKLPSTGGIQDKTSSGSMKDDINNNDRVFTEYKGGGSHENSSIGGIPIGQKAKVEDGEVRVNFDDGDYIFSDRY